MTPQEAWEVLGIAPTDDERAIKRAYSALLKAIDVDRDTEGFIRLRGAMETAKAWGTYDCEADDEEEWEPDEADEVATDGGRDDEWTAARLPFSFPHFGGEAYFAGYRPSPPVLADDELAELCARIDGLLFDEGGDEADSSERIGRAGRALLKAPALEQVDAAAAVEQWLAQAIAAAAPRSDPLGVPAINHFGWHRGGAGWNRPADVDAVLARYADRVWMVGPAADLHVKALAELTGPPRSALGWSQLGLIGDVTRFLKAVRGDHPSVLQDLNSDSVAWWDAYLAGRRPPQHFWMLVLPVPAMIACVVIGIVGATGSLNWPRAAFIYGGCVLAAVALIAVHSEMRMRAHARRDRPDRGQSAADLGWAPLLLALPFLVWAYVAAGPGPMGGLGGFLEGFVFGGIAVGAGIWGWWKSALEETDDAELQRRRRGFPIVAGLAGLFVALAAPGVHAALAPLPLAVLCAMGWQGYDAMAQANARLEARRWTAGVAALLIAHVAVGAALVLTLPDAAVPAMLAVPVLLIAQHWLLAGRSRELGVIEWAVRVVAVIVFFTHDLWSGESFALGGFAALSLYGLSLSAAALIVAWRQER